MLLEDNRIKKIAAYVVLGITKEGMKKVLSLEIGENESSKYWLGVLNALKNRRINDIIRHFDRKKDKKCPQPTKNVGSRAYIFILKV